MLGDVRLARRDIEPRPGTTQLQVTPVRPVAERPHRSARRVAAA